MKFYGIGVGPGDPNLLTLRAVEVLKEVERIFYIAGSAGRKSVSLSVVASLGKDIEAKCEPLVFSMAKDIPKRHEAWKKNAQIIAAALDDGLECAFSTIGDPMLYSTLVYVLPILKNLVPHLEIEVIPGITSFQAAAARAAMPLAMNDEILTIVPAWKKDILQNPALQESDTTVMLKTYNCRKEVADFIAENHSGEFLYASRIGLAEEKCQSNLKEFLNAPLEYLSMIISRKQRFSDGLD